MDSVVEINGVSKWYGSKAAVQKLSLRVPRGAIFALLGENGAGKSTTIRMLTGLLKPDAGMATILGRDCWRDAVALRHEVGYVPEKPRFYDWMTIAEIGWFTAGFYKDSFLPRYEQIIDGFKLEPKAKLQTLSKGQYSKVALALALAPDPAVLILDEPTSGLDLLVRREFLASMVELAGEGRTILICSHQIAEVERVASHVVFMSQGQCILTATMEDLRKRLVRFQLRYERHAPDAEVLGTVLQRNGIGRQWEAVILDPDRSAVETVRRSEGISEFEEVPLNLEEAYCALMQREGKS
ncbi:MAG TPA: ABC transporter ATP-binding protein [Gemmataceae bacterium]|jgi:ABC-2 type transport system ATP-binding protein|nr:ABC transporter ATP-binding protein [Gemmataceae bacterium]